MRSSENLFQRAKKCIPGGVNSPVRAFGSVSGSPIYIERGEGAYIVDVDGKRYLDFCSSWGPLIWGHAHEEIVSEVQKACENGLTFGACNSKEVEMAELIKELIPSIEMVRMVSSGTEATMSALRLARGYTKRRKVVKFDGCYHGHADYLLVAAGSGLLTGGIANSAGVPQSAVDDVIVINYNDLEGVKGAFKKFGSEIAAVIVEPVAGNMGLVEPCSGFLELLREETEKSGALLIFDEVITGFRFEATTYGELVGVTADLTCLGKIIGGGMPMAAFGGRKEIMEHLAPLGDVYQAGTLSGNPVALTAGLKTLRMLKAKSPYKQMQEKAKRIADAVNGLDLPVCCVRNGGLFTIFFIDKKEAPSNLNEVKQCNTERFSKYHRAMLDLGFYISPSQFELSFTSAVQSDDDITRFIAALCKVLPEVCR